MEEEKNFWYSIWFHPRETINDIVTTKPGHRMMLLAALGGFSQTLTYSSSLGLGTSMGVGEIFMLSVLSGPLAGVFNLFIFGWLMHKLLLRFGGLAELIHTRTVIAWSWAPLVSTLPLWGVKYILFREELFLLEKPFLESQPLLSFFYGLFQFIDIVLVVWTLVILLGGLSEVHRIPTRKAFAAFLLVNLLLLIPSMLLFMIFAPGSL